MTREEKLIAAGFKYLPREFDDLVLSLLERIDELEKELSWWVNKHAPND